MGEYGIPDASLFPKAVGYDDSDRVAHVDMHSDIEGDRNTYRFRRRGTGMYTLEVRAFPDSDSIAEMIPGDAVPPVVNTVFDLRTRPAVSEAIVDRRLTSALEGRQ